MRRMETIELPWPPSGNHQHGQNKNGGRYLNAKTKAYRQDVGWMCKRLDTYGTRKIHVEITAFPPDSRRRDLDNLCKPALDALMHAGVFFDDSQVDRLAIERGPVRKLGALLVKITEA